MAETGQIKLYGEHPTLTETALYRARRHLFKEERFHTYIYTWLLIPWFSIYFDISFVS